MIYRLFPSEIAVKFKKYMDKNLQKNNLYNYQLFIQDYVTNTNNKNILLYHGLGSGKTVTAISVLNAINTANVIIFAKTSLIEDPWQVTMSVWLKNKNIKNIVYVNFDSPAVYKYYIEAQKKLNPIYKTIIIIDEVHNFMNAVYNSLRINSDTNIVKVYNDLLKQSHKYNFLCLSSTPIINSPYELALLFNLLRYRIFSNIQEQEFIRMYCSNIDAFKRRILGLVSYYAGSKENIPTSNVQILKLKMSEYQSEYYNMYVNKNLNQSQLQLACNFIWPHIDNYVNPENRFKDIISNNIYIKKLSKYLKLHELKHYSIKYFVMLNIINSLPRGIIAIYSNYVNMEGLKIIKLVLKLAGYKNVLKYNTKKYYGFIEYSGDIDVNKRAKILELMRNPENKYGEKARIILFSAVATEGITLFNVRQLHIIEPSRYESTNSQIIGRVIRLNSHNMLPEDERHVDIYKYIATTNIETADVIIYNTAIENYKISQKFLDALKSAAVDCFLFNGKKCFNFPEYDIINNGNEDAYLPDPRDDLTERYETKKAILYKIKATSDKKNIEEYWYNPESLVIYDKDVKVPVGTIKLFDKMVINDKEYLLPEKLNDNVYIIDKLILIS